MSNKNIKKKDRKEQKKEKLKVSSIDLHEKRIIYLDGTYTKGIPWLLENYINGNRIPTMDELTNEFGYHEYDSYDYAYLIVSYLIEKLGKKRFLKLINDEKLLNQCNSNLIEQSIKYFNEKYNNKKIK